MSGYDGELRLFSPLGVPLTVLPARTANVAWVRNKAGGGTFTVPRAGAKWRPEYVALGNRAEYHSNALPAWPGVVLESEPLDAEATLTAIGAEVLYQGRFSLPYYLNIEALSLGALISTLHRQAERDAPLGIQVGALDTGGIEVVVEYELKRLSEALDELAAQTGGDYWVEKSGPRHRDPWLLRWARTRGRDRTADVVICNDIVDKPEFKRSAANRATALWGIGGGIGSHLDERLLLYRRHPRYKQLGLTEDRVEWPDIIDESLLDSALWQELGRRSQEARTVGVNIDNRRNNWGAFWLGDIVRLILPDTVDDAGGDLRVSVEGIQLDADAGKLGLTVLEVV